MKCDNCKGPIPDKNPGYIKGKQVCQDCFVKLKHTNGDGLDPKTEYVKWLNK